MIVELGPCRGRVGLLTFVARPGRHTIFDRKNRKYIFVAAALESCATLYDNDLGERAIAYAEAILAYCRDQIRR
jgi:hypothetical protein